jgi:hypothetical protein
MPHVREHDGGPDEHVLAELDTLPDAGVALDARARAHHGASRHEAERSDDGVVPEDGTLGDDAGRVNARDGPRAGAAGPGQARSRRRR